MTEEEIKTLTNSYTDKPEECRIGISGKGEYMLMDKDVLCAYTHGDYAEVSNGKAVLDKDSNRGGPYYAYEGDHSLCATYFDVNGDEQVSTTFKLTLLSSNNLSTGGGVLGSLTPLTTTVGGVTQ